MATLPGSLSDADRAAWEETARALDAIGAPQTEARFYSMFQECRAADDGPLDLPGLGGDGAHSSSLHDAPLYFSGGATGAPPGAGGGPFGGGMGTSNSAGAGMFAMLAQQGGMAGLVGADAPVATPVPQSAAAVAQPHGTAAKQAVEELDDDGLETIVLADDGPSPATGARGQGCGGSLEERVLSGDLSGGSVLFDNFTEGMDGDGGADLVGAGEAAASVKDKDDDDDETFASVAPSAPGAVGCPLGRRPRGALLAESRAAPAAVAVPSAPSSFAGPSASPTPPTDLGETGEPVLAHGAVTEAGEAFEIDPDFDYDIPASRLTSRFGGLGMPGPTSVGDAGRPGREGPVDSTGGDDPELEAAHAAAVTEALRGVRPDLAEQLLGAGRKV